MTTKRLGSLEDQQTLAPLLIEGKAYRECAAFLGWTYGRVSEAARALKGMPSDSRDGRDLRARSEGKKAETIAALRAAVAAKFQAEDDRSEELAEVLAQNNAAPEGPAPSDPTPPPAAPRRKRALPTPDEVRAKAADDLLTIAWSNWTANGEWVRVAASPEEVWGEDEDGEAQLSHLSVDPGVLWPADWDGPTDPWATRILAPPARPARFRALLTAAQNKTPLHGPALINLAALATYYGADVVVGGLVYGKGLFESRPPRDSLEVAPFSRLIADCVTRERVRLPCGIDFAAEMNSAPTAQRPLAGMAGYAKGRTTVFPHPRRALESVPRDKGDDPVLLWTTGAITVPNYVLRKAGLKALQSHCIGCVLVEEDLQGRVFTRDITFDVETGTAYDLDILVHRGVVIGAAEAHASEGMQGPVIAWGDVHRDHLNASCARAAWGIGGFPDGDVSMIDALRPGWQVLEDLLNFTSGSHHERSNPWTQVANARSGANRVEAEISQAADFIVESARSGTATMVVYSNHDEHYARWLRDTDWRDDPVNAAAYLRANLAAVEAIERGDEGFSVFEWALRRARPDARFSLVDCDHALRVYGVGYHYHGDRSPNGARGSTAGLARMGVPLTKFHDHALTIHDDVRSGGCLVDYPAYAKGASSWVHGCVVGHPDGSRQSVHFVDDKWRA